MKKIKVKVCDWYGHIHLYQTKGVRTLHPVHLIEGGDYITEDTREFNPAGDMGMYAINNEDYKYFKNHLVEKELEVNE